jgi:hypothetical protein
LLDIVGKCFNGRAYLIDAGSDLFGDSFFFLGGKNFAARCGSVGGAG